MHISKFGAKIIRKSKSSIILSSTHDPTWVGDQDNPKNRNPLTAKYTKVYAKNAKE
jgi:hypothetical protein